MFARSLLLSLGLALLGAGCGPASTPKDKPALAPVKGKLLQDGKPLADAYVEFLPDSGAPSTGRSDASGEFTLTYTDGSEGAKVGPHKVKVTVGGIVSPTGGGGEPTPKTARPPAPPVLYVLPDPVTVAPGPNSLDLTVPLKGQPG